MKKRITAIVLAAVVFTATVLSGCYMKDAIEGVFGVKFPEIQAESLGSEIESLFASIEEEETGNSETASSEESSEHPSESAPTLAETSQSESEEETAEAESSEEESTEIIPDREENEAFRAFTDEIFADMMSEIDSLTLHYFLMHPEDYDVEQEEVTLGDFDCDAEDVKEYEEEIREMLDGLHKFDREKLDREEKLTYDCTESYLETELQSIGLELFYEPLSPYMGIQMNLPLDFAEFAINEKADAELYLKLLNEVPEYFEEALEYEKKKADAGLFMEDGLLTQTLDSIDKFIAGEKDSILISSFTEKIDALTMDAAEKKELTDANEKAVGAVYQAYRDLRAGLEKMKGSGKIEGGLCKYPNGSDYYAYLVKAGTGSSMTPQEMIAALDQDMKETMGEMRLMYFRNRMLETELARFKFPDSDPNLCMRALIEKTKNDFPSLPDIEYTIDYVDASMRDYLSPACYMIPPYDTDNVNSILINCERGSEPEDIFITLAHEGYPGHLLQTNFLKEYSDIPLRYILETNGFSEGYATYVEELSYRYIEGISEDVAEYLMLNSRMSLDIYARVDLGIHAEGWGVKSITSFLEDYFEDPGEAAEWMYNYILGDPAGYLDYAIGSLEIRRLKDTASEAKNFSEFNFHSTLLYLSGAPFEIIRKYMFE